MLIAQVILKIEGTDLAIAEFHLGSNNVLGKQMSMTVIVPDSAPGPFPVLYLLGGLSDDHTTWHKMTGLLRIFEGLPLIIVMPNGERGFYTNNPTRPYAAYETYISRDVVGFIDCTLNTVPQKSARAIAGLSMGGYGAIKYALKYPGLFSSAASLSGALAVGRSAAGGDPGFIAEFGPVFGGFPTTPDNDLFTLSELIPHELRPPLFVSCGTEDFLLPHNRLFHEHLSSCGFAHIYEEHPGAHAWSYWDRHIIPALEFLLPKLGIDGVDFKSRQ
jgi:putative tributyrin esterase